MKRKTSYERWKAGEKVFKAPWVIRYYESITDLNQYKSGKVVEGRFALIIGVCCFCYGLFLGLFVGDII